ncbi:tetratricopeptide repeat protein [Candidatus Berkelbacteria bacterium]|nr:tetratricopeptide repeat protein [Candidatus Berkelbacteria bacterium]
MWSQVIFFTAVALVIIILLRKSAGAAAIKNISNSASGAPNVFISGLAWVVKLILSIGTELTYLFKSKLKNRGGVKSTPTRVSSSNSYAFWDEESPVSRVEISSHFDEADKLFKRGDFEQAEKLFIKAATSNPGDPKVYARLGLLYLQQKNFSDAIESLKVAAKLDKYNPSRHYNLSLAYMGNGDTQKAIASVREAITLDPVTQKYRQLLEQLLNG